MFIRQTQLQIFKVNQLHVSAYSQAMIRLYIKLQNIIYVVGWSVVKCSEVLQCSDGLSNKVSNIIRRLMDNMKFYEYYYHIPSYSLGSISFINVYMALFLFNNVIYVFLLSCPCILIVCLCMDTLTEGFPCFFFNCKANARVNPAKTGHGPHSS
jgi:hypothetical protein